MEPKGQFSNLSKCSPPELRPGSQRKTWKGEKNKNILPYFFFLAVCVFSSLKQCSCFCCKSSKPVESTHIGSSTANKLSPFSVFLQHFLSRRSRGDKSPLFIPESNKSSIHMTCVSAITFKLIILKIFQSKLITSKNYQFLFTESFQLGQKVRKETRVCEEMFPPEPEL